ncbi:MAG: hypothetical protein LUO82_04795, partial [Methanomicrobiales archaeon]|nr:hypothetical protein [Methanomicrobiales archaeon]
TIPGIVLTRLFGILVFLLLVAVLNMIVDSVNNEVFHQLVTFLTITTWLVVLFSILFLIGEVCYALFFPLNLLAPLFSALGSVFLVSFIFRLLYYLDRITPTTNFNVLEPLAPLIYLMIFLIVLLAGYIDIFTCLLSGGPRTSPPGTSPASQGESEGPAPTNPEWDDIGAEIRKLIFDIVHQLRESLKGNR